jgi:Ser/Thr protein kinase RdoA (MazF antagonist)
VTAKAERFILQRVSPIFPPAIHDTIDAVTRALAAAGLATPTLVRTSDGRLCSDLGDDGVWRLQTFVAGSTFDRPQSEEQTHSAGVLVGRFHRALDNLACAFIGMREGVHDTAKHLARLRETLRDRADHRLASTVAPIGNAILERAETLAPLPDLPLRVCHGDLKLNNILFAGTTPPARDRAVCLIDLDTVGPMSLAYELGDAWRSWCNRSGEDATQAEIDLSVLRASFEGYASAVGRDLSHVERRALLGGPEWISLELASRFAADVLNESYFGWDPQRYASRGDHNLVRCQGQLAVHEAFIATRSERAAILGL